MAQTVANLLIKFESDTGNAVRGINRVEASLQGVGQRTNSVGALLNNLGRAAAGVAVAGLATLGGAMVATAVDGTKMAMDLESGMSAIASTMQRSREEIEPLKALILELGMNPNLKVSTLEAAEAIDALANNGVKMTEILEGAAEATVLLSNATGGKFALSADIMSDVMKQFKDSAGGYTQAVNGIVAVTSKSKFTIDDYRLALAQAGGVASSVGVEFGDFNVTMAAISPLFGSGSDAGTSFKTMLQTLIPKSNDAKTAMAELGLIAADGSNAFFDAQGNLKGMADISSILQGALAGLSEEQKNAALSTIFGSDAMRAAVALADSGKVVYTDVALAAKELGVSQEALNGVAKDGITAFEALQVQMGNVDALEAAATRMDNAKGALEILGGVIETVKIQIGDAFLPVVRQLSEQLAAFVGDNSGRIVTFFGGFAAGVAIAAGYIPTLVQGIFDLAAWLGSLYTALQTTVAGWQPFIDAVLAVVQPVADAVTGFVSWQDILIAVGGIIGTTVVTALAGMVAAMAPVAGAVLGLIAAASLLRNGWENDWGGIRTAVTGAWEAMQPTLGALSNLIIVLQDAGAGSIEAQEALTLLSAPLQNIVGGALSAYSALQNYAAVIADAGINSIEAREALTLFPQAVQDIINTVTTAAAVLGAVFAPTLERIKASFAGVIEGFGALGPQVQPVIGAFQNLADAMLPVAALFGGAVVTVMVTGINLIGSTFAALPEIVGEALTTVTDLLNGLADVVRSATALVIAVITGDWAGAWTAAGELVRSFADTIGTVFVDLNEIVETLLGVIRDTIVATFTDLANILRGFGVDVDGAITKLTSLGEWIAKLFTGDMALNFTAPAWITTLMDWMWPDFIVVPDWVTTLLVWGWPLFINQPGWLVALVAWKWPSFISQPSWVSDLVIWEWPYFSMPEWLDRLFNWSWPSFPKLPSWLGGSDETTAETGTTTGSGRSALALPGRPALREPGLVGAGAGGITITINASVANNLDIETLAYRVAAIIQRRG